MKKIRSIAFFVYCNGMLIAIIAMIVSQLPRKPTLIEDEPILILLVAMTALLATFVDFSYLRRWLANRPPKEPEFRRPLVPFNWWNSYE